MPHAAISLVTCECTRTHLSALTRSHARLRTYASGDEEEEEEETSSISTTASVRRLNEAINDLGFYMRTEINHVESIAKQVVSVDYYC